MSADNPGTPGADQLAELTSRLAALEERLSKLEDERAIRELLARYGYHADAGRDDEYLALFTDDGAYDISMGGSHGAYPEVVRFEGKDRLNEFIKDPMAHHRPDYYGQSLHVQGNNLVVHLDGDRAIVNSYSIVLRQNEARGAYLHAAGTNQWTLERHDGEWRIKERRRREMGHPETDENLSATPR